MVRKPHTDLRNVVLATARYWLVDTLFPRTCVGCGVTDTSLCESCRQLIVPVLKQQCVRCHAVQEGGRTCPKCRSHIALYQTLAAVHFSDGPVREALHWIKYHGRVELLQQLGQYMVEQPDIDSVLQALYAKHDTIIVPVPLHRSRMYWRGFNQSQILASMLARRYSHLITTGVLRRRSFNRSQIGLQKRGRAENVRHVFFVPSPVDILGKTVVVVDDILTTGATLNACALALKQAGAKRVIGVVLARAV